MAESAEGSPILCDTIWQRLASPRETMFALRTDGSPRSICCCLAIHSAVKIELEVLERCAIHFNREIKCFHEFFMELKVSKDVGLVKMEESYFVVGKIMGENEMVRKILDEEINSHRRAEYHPKWKLFYKYNGYDSSGVVDSEGYPYIYQLIFVFSTGTLDDFSCARACKLFLIILDCALTNVEFPLCSQLNYDVGSSLESKIAETIKDIQSNERHREMAEETFMEMLSSPCSNFNFINIDYKKEDNRYTTVKCFFSSEETRAVMEICNEKNVDIFAVFIAVINNNLLHYAIENGFKGIFRTRVLHAINGRKILQNEDLQHKLGYYSLPYMQHFELESTDVEDIFKEASKIESRMIKFVKLKMFCDQEALREIIIKKSGNYYNSGKWNPHYCYSVTNMGTLDGFYPPEDPFKKFRLLSFDRTSSVIEGGYFDVIIHFCKGELNVFFDFSNKYFSTDKMSNIIKTFKQTVISLT